MNRLIGMASRMLGSRGGAGGRPTAGGPGGAGMGGTSPARSGGLGGMARRLLGGGRTRL